MAHSAAIPRRQLNVFEKLIKPKACIPSVGIFQNSHVNGDTNILY